MRYVTKQHEIEAFKWTGDEHQTEDPEWIVQAIKSGLVSFTKPTNDGAIYMRVGDENHKPMQWAERGDYIIWDNEQIRVCDAKEFHQEYREA